MPSEKDHKRRIYLCVCGLLVLLEILIALFVRDRFIRPYVGDVIVVMVIHCFVRIFLPDKAKLLPLYVFLFAVAIEVLQFFDYVALLGLENNRFMSILLGRSFSFADLLCYLVGCSLCFGAERLVQRWLYAP